MTITFVGAGSAVTGNNPASLSPGLHASTQEGDVVLVLVSIRGTSANPNGFPGSTLVADNGNMRVYGRVYQAGDPTPVLTFSGGVAGDDAFAQAATFRGVEPTLDNVLVEVQSNASAQNIAYPGLTIPGDAMLVVVAGWKQDDWTSVATLASATEIAETSSTTGNDAAQVWDYQIQTSAIDVIAGSFTVTGGASAISKSIVLAIRQAATLTADEQDVYPPRVQLSLTGLTLGDDVVLYRQVAGVRTAIRAGTVTSVTDPSLVRVDAELPFGVPVTYVAVVNSAAEYTAGPTTYTLPGGKVAITDAITALAAEVVILAWDEKAQSRESTVFKVGGRNVVVAGSLPQWESTIELYVETTSSLELLTTVLAEATEAIVQIRQPGGYDGVDSYVAVIAATTRRFSQDGSDERRIVAVQVAEVEAWAAELEARGYTYQDLADVYDGLTYLDLEGDYATYLALAQADLGV